MKRLFISKYLGVLLAAVFTLSFFLPKILEGKIPIPGDALLNLYHPWRDVPFGTFSPGRFPAKNTLITDPVLQTYPWRELVIENLKSQVIPLWNPYSFGGQPLLANVQSSVFQVLNIFFFIFPFKLAWSLNIILPSILTSVFTYLFLSNLEIGSKKLSKTAALFGATILPFSGFFIAWLEWGTIVTTAMWLPLILLAINKIFSKHSPLWLAALIFAVSQTIFSGHLQTAIYVLLASTLYLAAMSPKSRNFAALSKVIAGLVLGILIAAPQILPTMEFINLSSRTTDQGYFDSRLDWFIPVKHLVQIVAPDFFGNPTTLNYWGVWNYGEFVSFVGVIPLILALFALLKMKEIPSSRFFAVLLFISLLSGLSNPISKLPYTLNLPLVSSMQPSRIIFLLVFGLGCLSAFGLELFLKEKNKLKLLTPAFFVLTVQLLLLYLSYIKSPIFFGNSPADAASISLRNLVLPILTSVAFLLIIIFKIVFKNNKTVIVFIFAITAFELFRFTNKFTPFTQVSLVFPQTSTIEFLKSQKEPFRIMTTDRRIMHPNSSTVYAIESADGYDPLYLKKYAHFVSAWQSADGHVSSGSFNRIITPQKINSNFADVLNVKYLLSFDVIENENLNLVHQEGETKIYENKNVNPRAYFVKEVIKKASENDELATISSSDFKPREMATSKDISMSSDITMASVEITSYADNQIEVRSKTQNDSPLVISNVNYPGWRAFIDGKETKIFDANSTFQLLIIPEGTHKIRVKFEPKSFGYGLILMLAGAIGSFILVFYLWHKKSL